MIESKTLGSAAGIQRQDVIDKSAAASFPALSNGVIVGRFKRGRMDRPFVVTAANYQALLGVDPFNPSYLVVDDSFKRGARRVYVMRIGDVGTGSITVDKPLELKTIYSKINDAAQPSVKPLDITLRVLVKDAMISDATQPTMTPLDISTRSVMLSTRIDGRDTYNPAISPLNITLRRLLKDTAIDNNDAYQLVITPLNISTRSIMLSTHIDDNNAYQPTVEPLDITLFKKIPDEPPTPIGETVKFTTSNNRQTGRELKLSLYIEEPLDGWALYEAGVLIVDASGIISDESNGIRFYTSSTGFNFELYTAGATKSYEFVGKAKSLKIIHPSDEAVHHDGTVNIENFSSNVDGYQFNMRSVKLTVPNRLPPNVTSLKRVLADSDLFNQDINDWGTGNIEDMSSAFDNCYYFDHPIGAWDTSKVTNMDGMFDGATEFNQDISKWDVSRVTNMEAMFKSASSFNCDLSQWCVANISTQPYRFSYNTPSWLLPRPIFGTCPRGENAPA